MDNFKLPGSSYLELVKMIRAYGLNKPGISYTLDDISKSSLLDKSQISRNNGFFVSIGLLEDGKSKTPTELCYILSKAYSLNIVNKISEIWQQIIRNNSFLCMLIAIVKASTSIEKSKYINQIIYYSESSDTNNARAGASALIEIFKISNMLTEYNDTIYPGEFFQKNIIDTKKELLENSPEKQLDKNQEKTLLEKEKLSTDIAFLQEFMCSSGEKAKILIPNSATKDDIITMFEVFKVILKRKYKISDDDLN